MTDVLVCDGSKQLAGCFGTLGIKTERGRFGSVTPETQQAILEAFDGVWADLGRWLKLDNFTHEDGIKLVRMLIHERKIAPEILLNLGRSIFPEAAQRAAISPQDFVKRLEIYETREKFAAVLLSSAEPDPETLQFLFRTIKDTLPGFRQFLVQSIEGLPHFHRGGRTKELPDPKIRGEIREEIKRLRGPGVKLDDLYERLAQRYGVSPTTIKRIRLEEESGNPADPSHNDDNSL
jgi:hypothetical protein